MIRTMRSILAVCTLLVGTVGAAHALDPRPGVKLRALDKITGAAQDIELDVDETLQFLGMSVTLRACYQSRPEDLPPEAAAYLEIETDRSRRDDGNEGFAGWMFASSPGLNALEDPVYDVWVISCTAASPESADPASPTP